MADIIPLPIKFRPRLVREGTTPAEDLEYALKMAWERARNLAIVARWERAQNRMGIERIDDPPQDGPRSA